MNKISSYRPHWSNRIKHHHIKWSALLVLSALIITSLTPLLKTTFTPKLANAATPTITRLSQTIGLPAGGDKVTIYGSGFELAEFNQISAGDSHTCALGSNNQAYCWGLNGSGELGNGNTTQQSTPVAVLQGAIPAGVHLTQISAGDSHTCALGSNNKAYCWGYNGYGQLGNGNTTQQLTPVAVSQGAIPTGAHLTQISAGYYHTCALDSDNKAYCWGQGSYGQLATNSTQDRYTPAYVMMKENPQIAFGTSAEHGNSTAPLATLSSFPDIPSGQYYLPGPTNLTLTTPAHSAGHVAVKVTNADGQSSSSDIAGDNSNRYTYVSAPSAPLNLQVTSTTPTGTGSTFDIALSWNTPADDGFAPITDYRVEYCISNSTGTCSGGWSVYPDGTSTNLNTTLSNLPASSTSYYTFRVAAINSIGTGSYSNLATTQTSYITLSTSSSNVNINLNPATTANNTVFSSNYHTITSTSNNPTGYNITLSMNGTNTNLTHNTKPTNTITPTTGTFTTPLLDMPLNSWGYRLNTPAFNHTGSLLDNTTETNQATSQYSWARVQPSTSPDTIHTTNTQDITGTTIPIYYGLKANVTKPLGTYTGIVRYTAVTK